MSNVKIQGDASGTGTLTLAAPNTNTDRTLTLPDTTAPILAGSGITLSASAPANTLVNLLTWWLLLKRCGHLKSLRHIRLHKLTKEYKNDYL